MSDEFDPMVDLSAALAPSDSRCSGDYNAALSALCPMYCSSRRWARTSFLRWRTAVTTNRCTKATHWCSKTETVRCVCCVAIDPKPYLSDREYDVTPFLWNPLHSRLNDTA
ncbi:MAG: hypothetical protein ACYCPT_00145 [Acidimicrobiales bacterium]